MVSIWLINRMCWLLLLFAIIFMLLILSCSFSFYFNQYQWLTDGCWLMATASSHVLSSSILTDVSNDDVVWLKLKERRNTCEDSLSENSVHFFGIFYSARAHDSWILDLIVLCRCWWLWWNGRWYQCTMGSLNALRSNGRRSSMTSRNEPCKVMHFNCSAHPKNQQALQILRSIPF